MREYLFRGKRLDNDEWVEGDLFQDRDLGTVHIQGFDYYSTEEGLQRDGYSFEVDPETVGQFTGLTDKNNRKIFEGDILHTSYHSERDRIVFFDNGRFRWKFVHACGIYDAGAEDCVCLQKESVQNQSVIGNIHDNPELLEGTP